MTVDRLRRSVRALPFAVLAVGVAVLMLSSGVPHVPLPEWLTWDKLQHALAWAALTLAAWCLPWPRQLTRWVRAAWTWGAMVAYGALLELAQHSWVPGRFGELADGVADALGATVAVGLAWIVERRHDARVRSGDGASPAGDDATLQGVGPGGSAPDALQ